MLKSGQFKVASFFSIKWQAKSIHMNNSEYPVGRWLLGKLPYKFDPSPGEGSTVTCLEETNVSY